MKKTILLFIFVSAIRAITNAQNISFVWANTGEDKVTQDELRGTHDSSSVLNAIWNGQQINLFGAKNEVIAFNVIIEAAQADASNITIEFDSLAGAQGSVMNYKYASGENLFNWVDRSIELFYVRYLQIKGLSSLGYENYYDERHVPFKLRRPIDSTSSPGRYLGVGTWFDRPSHNKFYPDIAVPLELQNGFTVKAGSNQSIWCDIYIPKTASNSIHTGKFIIRENGTIIKQIPVKLNVCDFSLPDAPSSKTILDIGSDINKRYTGQSFPNPNTWADSVAKRVYMKHFMMAHRHKISLIGGYDESTPCDGKPGNFWLPILDGSLFSTANGYSGPGINVGNNVYSIATYGSWKTAGCWDTLESDFWTQTNKWETWFKANSPNTEHFLYLIDESANYPQTEKWAKWMKDNPGIGKSLKSFATLGLQYSIPQVPSLDITCQAAGAAIKTQMDSLLNILHSSSSKEFYMYNGFRPFSGAFQTEEDGVGLLVNPWAQFKKGISRWFFWESTYWNNFQGDQTQIDVFNRAENFGYDDHFDSIQGEHGYQYTNGDGLLFYPGTDSVYKSESYNINGPIASLRLKHWRRGIQDVDYLTLAKASDSAQTNAILNSILPKILWECDVTSHADPTWLISDINWSINPDVWTNARMKLAKIIGGCDLTLTVPSLHNDNFSVSCFPNPAHKMISVSVKRDLNYSGDFTVILVNCLGQEVFRQVDDRNNFDLDLSAQSDGIYFLRVSMGNETKQQKLILN